jgi:putative transposase
MPFKPFNRDAVVTDHDKGKLPHWRQSGTTYFITSRLADSIPAALRDDWLSRRTAWLASHNAADPDSLPEDLRNAFHRKFTAEFHKFLDAGHGECLLARAECADIFIGRLIAGHGSAYFLDAWVVMPNHVHALVEPAKGSLLGEIVRSWKGGSSREINLLLGRSGSLWQKEPYDHIVRSEAQLNHYRQYIAQNPFKAGLRSGYRLGTGACESSQRL